MAAEAKGRTDRSSIKESQGEYLLIGSIPGHLNSSDLRAFFSQYVERDAFVCFHYRHRPETFRLRPQARTEELSTAKQRQILYEGSITESHRAKTCCCVVKIRPELANEFIGYYHGKHWVLLPAGRTLPQKVRIGRMTLKEDASSVMGWEQHEVEKKTISEGLLESGLEGGSVSGEQLALQEKMDVSSMIELNPPALMPQGNVGTPTATFMNLINSCRLPTKVIRKLKLEFPKSRTKRRYGAVPLDYGTEGTSEAGGPVREGVGEVGWEGVRAHVLEGIKGGGSAPPHEGQEDVPSVRGTVCGPLLLLLLRVCVCVCVCMCCHLQPYVMHP